MWLPAKPPVNEGGDIGCDGGTIWVRTTAYCHLEGDHISFGRKSAKGTPLRYGKIRSAAADWSRFPLGTKFKIEGDPSTYIVDDYGIALTDSWTIDIYKPTMAMMRKWGVRRVKIQVLEWGSLKESLRILKTRSHRGAYIRRMIKNLEEDSGMVAEAEPSDKEEKEGAKAESAAVAPSKEADGKT